MGKYYGLYGKNGLGVFNDYAKVQSAMKYLDAPNCKKFKTFYEAEEFAVKHYNQYQNDPIAVAGECLKLRINWVEYRKNIIENNQNKRSITKEREV